MILWLLAAILERGAHVFRYLGTAVESFVLTGMVPHPEGRKRILQTVQVILDAHQEIPLAYLFDSFAEGETYRDIDVAIYCDTTHHRVRDLFDDIALSQETKTLWECRLILSS